jgi:hypothetical protein
MTTTRRTTTEALAGVKLCPNCRRAPGVMLVGLTGRGGAFVSWACEGCQAGVDRAMAAWAIAKGVARGDLSARVLLSRMG